MKKFLILFLNTLLIISCSDLNTIKKREIIDDDTFLKMLIDIHLSEGIISASNLRLNQDRRDSVSVYNYIFKKHNVSREEFKKTVKYYSYHTDRYLVFYDSIEAYFKRMNKNVEAEISQVIEDEKKEDLLKKDSLNLWPLKTEWNLPEDGETNPIAFHLQAEKQGQYTLEANFKIYPDDKSIDQRMTIIANYTDGTKDLNTVGSMVKDGKFERYSVSIFSDKEKLLKSISGWVFDHSKNTEKKHADIKDITLKYSEEITNQK